MATIQGTYVNSVDTGNPRINKLINVMLFPTLAEFEQIMINYETGTILGQRSIRFTYSNWNETFPVEIYFNGGQQALSPNMFTVDYSMGRVNVNFDLATGDSVLATYCFNYFPAHILEGFIHRAIVVANTAGNGATNSYTIENIPEGWLGVIADLVVSMCMEKLILEYDLWKGRLVFAISNNGIYEGSDNIVSQLETVKRNAEDRAYKSIDNPKFHSPVLLAGPSEHYYEALIIGSAARYKNGNPSYGALRGAKFNRLVGPLPRQ